MPRAPRIYLPVDSWPAEDQARWRAAFKTGDRFEGVAPVRTLPSNPAEPVDQLCPVRISPTLAHGSQFHCSLRQ